MTDQQPYEKYTVGQLMVVLSKLPSDMEILSAHYDYSERIICNLQDDAIVIIEGNKAIIDPMDLMNLYVTIDEFLGK